MSDNFSFSVLNKHMTSQEVAEHGFITDMLEDEHFMVIAFACERNRDVIPAQFYFACLLRDDTEKALNLLEQLDLEKVKIKRVRRGAPEFSFLS